MNAHPISTHTSTTDSRTRRIAHLAALFTLIALVLGANRTLVVAAVQVWIISPTFSHCFLILPIVVYLIWAERERLAAATAPILYPPAIAILVPVSMIGMIGILASINEVAQFAIIASINLVALAFLGPRIYRIILFPLCYLFFLVPSGEYLIGPLQRFTTAFISSGLDLLKIPHYTEGNVIELANGRYAVEEACAGLRFLIATIALGVLFAYLNFRKWRKIIVFMLACAIIPIIGNGFRALGIVLLAHFTDNRLATGADHLIYGWGFSVAIMFVLFLIGSHFRDSAAVDAPGNVSPAQRSESLVAFVAVLVGIAITLSAGPILAYWQNQRGHSIDAAAFSATPDRQGWVFSRSAMDWKPLFVAPDATIAFSVAPSQAPAPAVNVLVNYYAGVTRAHLLVASSNKLWDESIWHPVTAGTVTIVSGSTPIHFAELLIASDREQRMIWWTYWTNGRFTTNPIDVKFASLRSIFLGDQGSALIVITTPIEGTVSEARERLGNSLPPLAFLPPRLNGMLRTH
jgi:exosortase A